MGSPTVLCVGHVNWDIVMHANGVPDPEQSSAIQHRHASSGGSATNTALVLAGIDTVDTVHMVGSIGDDEAGDRVRQTLTDHGVETVLKETEIPTTVIQALITPDADPRYFHENVDVGEFGPDFVPDDVWSEVDHVHVTSFDKEIAGAFAEEATARDATVSFNPSQGYRHETFDTVVENADLIFLNQEESEVFTQRHGAIGSVVDSEAGTDIVVTHGGAGCTLYSVDGLAHHEGFRADSVVDTVGAGDTFIAGYLSAWTRGGSAEEALRVANAYGAASVTHAGAPDRIPDEDVAPFLDE